jgi:hypothetical protein
MIERIGQNHRMSMAVSWPLSGRMVALAGQVADNRDDGVAAQTRNVLDKIDRLLGEAASAARTSSRPISGWQIFPVTTR